jgi:hypothetical protein
VKLVFSFLYYVAEVQQVIEPSFTTVFWETFVGLNPIEISQFSQKLANFRRYFLTFMSKWLTQVSQLPSAGA